MRHIDWLGLPGSGKSTIRKSTLAWAGEVTPTLSTNSAVVHYLKHHSSDPVWRIFGKVIPASLVSRFAQPAFLRSSDHFNSLRTFMLRYPEVVEVALAATRRRADFEPRSDKTLGWLLHLAAVFSAAERLPRDPVVLFDEGFTNRAVSLFGYRFGGDDEPDLRRYMRSIPHPAAVVYMATPVEKSIERMDNLSSRFEGLPVEERIAFMHSAQRCVEMILDHLTEIGVPICVVDNAGDVDDVTSDLRRQLTPILRGTGVRA